MPGCAATPGMQQKFTPITLQQHVMTVTRFRNVPELLPKPTTPHLLARAITSASCVLEAFSICY